MMTTQPPKEIILNDRVFELLKVQRSGLSIYKGDEGYLRIGEPPFTQKALTLHRRMEDAGFPVPRLLETGSFLSQDYFVEESFGDKRLTDLFANDVAHAGSISNAHFDAFLKLTLHYLRAQIKTATVECDVPMFATAIHLPVLLQELPAYSKEILARFEKATEDLKKYPYVLTHGDFNPSNMYEHGVIDFEDSFNGPLGYDAVTALCTTDWFPHSTEYEFIGRYRFTNDQKNRYYTEIDSLFVEAGFNPLSSVVLSLEFCRGIWLTARMGAWPKLQKFRYDMLIQKYLT